MLTNINSFFTAIKISSLMLAMFDPWAAARARSTIRPVESPVSDAMSVR